MNLPMAAPGPRGRRVGLAGASWSGGGLPTRGGDADLLLPAALALSGVPRGVLGTWSGPMCAEGPLPLLLSTWSAGLSGEAWGQLVPPHLTWHVQGRSGGRGGG